MSPYVLIFECLIYVLFALCLWDTWQRDRFAVSELLWTALYGFLLEWLTLKQLQAYHYGQFLILIDGAPLSVALGWGVVIYSAMCSSSRLQMPEAVRPILDALLAISIDLTFDVIAVRLGMWTWRGVALDQQWFGVPWANFWAWFLIVWSYSALLRALRLWQGDRFGRWLYAPLALLISLLILIGANELYPLMLNTENFAAASLFLLAGSLLLVVNAQPRVAAPAEPLVALVPLIFHGFALLVGISAGIFARQPLFGMIALTLFLVSLGIHRLPRRIKSAAHGDLKSRR